MNMYTNRFYFLAVIFHEVRDFSENLPDPHVFDQLFECAEFVRAFLHVYGYAPRDVGNTVILRVGDAAVVRQPENVEEAYGMLHLAASVVRAWSSGADATLTLETLSGMQLGRTEIALLASG
jgi:hypothetical protein